MGRVYKILLVVLSDLGEGIPGWELIISFELKVNLFKLLNLLIEPQGVRDRGQVLTRLNIVRVGVVHSITCFIGSSFWTMTINVS